MKLKTIFLSLILFMGSGYFRLIFFSVNVIAVSQALVIIYLFGTVLANLNKLKLTIFQRPIFFILGCVFISAFNAIMFHDQDFATTFLEQRFMYFYLLYFYLLVTKPDIDMMYNTILILASLVSLIVIIQVIVYPIEIVNSSNFLVERSTVRFRIDGQEYIYLGLFFLIDRMIRQGFKVFQFGLVILLTAGLFLQGSRYILFACAVGIFLLFINSKEKARAIVVMFLLFVAAIFLIPTKYYEEITALTADQIHQGDSYIRVKAANYFLFNFSDNISEVLFGNGQYDASSAYGAKITRLGASEGYFLSDVGFIGDYARFGLIYLCVYFSLIYKTMRKSKKTTEFFFLITVLLMSLLSWPFSYAAGVICFSICLYIVNEKARLKKIMLNSQAETQLIKS